jgi:molecular chaperone HtpG
MQIPTRLAYILERDQSLDGGVRLSISQFEPWIAHSNLPFFPEYTKHDVEHIEAVLRTAVGLIRDEAWETITPSDAAVLILAILLHDCAMHLSEDGFISLLGPVRRDCSVPEMADKPWHILWEDFCLEASRFDGRKLLQLFGDTQPVRRPPMDPNELTKRDRLLIGEFLRRHHPRLAQEIAIFGVPAKGSSPLVLEGFAGPHDYIVFLSAIVARSHGASVRAYLPYLRDHFDLRQYKGVHPVFLMALLRVADYLQIEAERAPAQFLRVQRLSSPVSEGEWKAHHAIKDVRHTHEDPEALFVDADPEDIGTFLRVETWLRGIQQELDATWAVLGEVYGRYEALNRLGIVLRRIRSSLDNADTFAEKAAYVPKKAVFRAADADLLKLLIGPLYENSPGVGLRELIQNAVDAVRELKQYWIEVPGSRNLPLSDQAADVVVSVEKGNPGEAWLITSDKGIGMTSETIINYFLVAGASFRRSDHWRRIFENKDGKSKVLRSGRFGVGALATFLLGPEIEVSTRHVDEKRGIEFRATVDSDSIKLRKIDRPVGTTIKIRVRESLAERLTGSWRAQSGPVDWDWFCLAEPSVKRTVFGKELMQKHFPPSSGNNLPKSWREISHGDFEAVLWTYSAAPQLVCNGIKIESAPHSSWAPRFGLKLPNVAVLDPDGKLPLNLQRTGLAVTQYPFEAALVEDVCRDFIAFALMQGPFSVPSDLEMVEAFRGFAYPGSSRGDNFGGSRGSEDWYFSTDGFGYVDASTIHSGGFESVLVVCIVGGQPKGVPFTFSGSQVVMAVEGQASLLYRDRILREMAELGYYDATTDSGEPNWSQSAERVLNRMSRKGARVLLSKEAAERLVQKDKLTKAVRLALQAEWTVGDWHLLSIGDCPDAKFDFKSFVIAAGSNLGSFTVLSEVYLDNQPDPPTSPVGAKWLELLKHPEIPFDLHVRREKLKHAYENLSSCLDAYQLSSTGTVEGTPGHAHPARASELESRTP